MDHAGSLLCNLRGAALLDQRFTGKFFLRLTSLQDIIRFKLGRNRSEYLEKLDLAANNITAGSCDFSDLTSYTKRGKQIFKPNTLESVYALRRVNKILGRIYKVKQSDRDAISRQINSLVSDTSKYIVIKGDVKSFYESIPRDAVYSKIESNRILSHQNRNIIKNIFSCETIQDTPGLPRGISISSSLSELYIREFDRHIRSLDGVYYYARYVDDFVIFCHSRSGEIIQDAEHKLKLLGLSLNRAKMKKINSENILSGIDTLTFLGYEHISDGNTTKIRISQSRIRKIKTRIVLAYLDYAKNKDIELLCLRLKFITGNYLIREPSPQDSDARGLMAGFYYNNQALNDLGQLLELDSFLMRLCRSKRGSIYRNIGATDMRAACVATQGITFDKGFNQRKVYSIARSDFPRIKKCWRKEELYEKKSQAK